jgi:hypothetical protein
MQGHLEELKRGGRPMTKNEIKLNNLNKGIDELIEKYNKRYDSKGFYLDVENTMICEFIKDLKKLKGE